MKVLVTGGAGFIGSNFIRYVLSRHGDWEIVNMDKLTYAGNLLNLEEVEGNDSYEFIKGDITDRSEVDNLFQENNFDVVVNFAAESHVDRSVVDSAPFVKTNISGTQVLLEVAKKYWKDGSGSERFVQISTDEVYGELGETGKFTERSPIRPNSPYAASKASADMLCRSYEKAHGLPVLITRSSNNYGPYQFPEKLIPLMIRNALKGKELPVYGEGKEVRDWLYVEDNCRAIEKVLRKGEPGEVYNIGSNHEKRNIEVVDLIVKKLKNHERTSDLDPDIKFIEDPRGSAHDFRYALDCEKVRSKIGWEPHNDFETGLDKTINWYLDNEEWVESTLTGDYKEHYEKIYGDLKS